MSNKLRFSDLTECPFCGGKEYYTKGYIQGPCYYNERFDGKEAENGEMYESTVYTPGARAYCTDCKAYLGNTTIDKIGKEAERALKVGASDDV